MPQKIDRTGERVQNRYGDWCTIIEYQRRDSIVVQFDDGTIKKSNYRSFKQGIVQNPNKPNPLLKNRMGEKRLNNQGCEMIIIDYVNKKNIKVQFLDDYGYIVNSTYAEFSRGGIKNPYHPTIFGKGFSGTKAPIRQNGIVIKEYITWRGMLERCYSPKMQEKCPSYIGCEVCEEWLNYENFYTWIHTQPNFNQWINLPKSALDKDILIKNNKIYSPNTCVLVPHEVNTIFCIRDRDRGSCVVGVWKKIYKSGVQYIAQVNDENHKRTRIGIYNTEEEAFEAYKTEKENIIKRLAKTEYENGNITEQCYNAMLKYQIEITD